MKKIFIAFAFSVLVMNSAFAAKEDTLNDVLAPSIKGFSLDDALNSLELKTERPQYLAGVSETAQFNSNELQGDASDITRFIEKIAKSLTGAAAAIAIIMIVLNAMTLVASAGDSDAISNAKKGLLWSFLGLLLIIFAYVIIKSIIATTYIGGEEAVIAGQAAAATEINCPEPKQIPIPPAIYGEDGDTGEFKQHKQVGTTEKFPSELLKLGIGSTGIEVQTFLKNKECYTGLSANCQELDGLYGQCTMKALQAYSESLQKEYDECRASQVTEPTDDQGGEVDAGVGWNNWGEEEE
jgi:hypothetical protein